MTLNFYTLGVIYLIYSFLGWVGETIVATIKGRSFANRGAAAGPFCFVYGTTAVLLAAGYTDLRTQPVYLFFACMLSATIVEWLTAKLLELGQKVQPERLCLPAVLGAVGSAGRGECSVGQ